MASKKTLNIKNLEQLGAQRLAELVMEIATGSAESKRKCRLALAAAQGSDDVSREVNKRLNAIRRSTAFIDWQKRKKLATDLNTQYHAITTQIAPDDPKEAAALLWRFMSIAESIFERCDDSSGTIIGIFHNVCESLGEVERQAKNNVEVIAEQVFHGILHNGYGQYDGIISYLAKALGEEGLEHLKQMLKTYIDEPLAHEDSKEAEWCSMYGKENFYQEIRQRRKDSLVNHSLAEIASLQDDVDSYIALCVQQPPYSASIAANLAARLLKAGRMEEAWQYINTIENEQSAIHVIEWVDTRVHLLESQGRKDEAQAFRWTCFEQTLRVDVLKEYLSLLDDFEDQEHEEKAMHYVASFSDLHAVLEFLSQWLSAYDTRGLAESLLLSRSNELDGNQWYRLPSLAEWLEPTHPLAATIIMRAMIDNTLASAKSKRYVYAARDLQKCRMLSALITDYSGITPHQEYDRHIQEKHKRKHGFWQCLEGPVGTSVLKRGTLRKGARIRV